MLDEGQEFMLTSATEVVSMCDTSLRIMSTSSCDAKAPSHLSVSFTQETDSERELKTKFESPGGKNLLSEQLAKPARRVI